MWWLVPTGVLTTCVPNANHIPHWNIFFYFLATHVFVCLVSIIFRFCLIIIQAFWVFYLLVFIYLRVSSTNLTWKNVQLFGHPYKLFLKVRAFWDISPYRLMEVGLCSRCVFSTRHYFPESCHLHTRRREELKCHSFYLFIFTQIFSLYCT
jgi:hypothetical protein